MGRRKRNYRQIKMPFQFRKTSYAHQFKDFKAPDVNDQFNLEIEHYMKERGQSPPLEK
jgi:hypothetical protein